MGRVFGNRSAVEVGGQRRAAACCLRHRSSHRFSAKGHSFYANVGASKVPAELSPLVAGFASSPKGSVQRTRDQQHPGLRSIRPHIALMLLLPISAGASYAIAPGDLHTIYDIPTATQAGAGGQGITIGVVGDSNINLGTINNYQSTFGLPQTAPTVIVDGQ